MKSLSRTLIAMTCVVLICLSSQHIIEFTYNMIFDKYPVYFLRDPFRFINTDFTFLFLIEIPNILIGASLMIYFFVSYMKDKTLSEIWNY